MADRNPTGSDPSVALDIPTDHHAFLRSVFETAREGIQGDLADFPERLREPERLRREEAAYGRLLAALDAGVIVPDRDVRCVLGRLARVIDAANDFERVLFEHRAICRLLVQVDPAGGQC